MKKKFFAALCLLLAGLYACGGVISEETQIPTTDSEAVDIATTLATSETSALSPTESKINENDSYFDVINFIISPYQNQLDKLNGQYYALYDIDGNGIEELLWSMDVYGGKSFNSIFTIQNGVVVEVNEFFSAYRFPEQASQTLLFRNGIIRSDNNHEGVPRYNYYRFEDGKIKPLTAIFTVNGDYYSLDPVTGDEMTITKREFDRLQKEMEGDGQIVELDWKPLAEYGR